MSGGAICRCPEAGKPLEARRWRVTAWRCNHSAFNGRRYTPSRYSEVVCLDCRAMWRTLAAYPGKLEPLNVGEL
jgi:hypothetical protein